MALVCILMITLHSCFYFQGSGKCGGMSYSTEQPASETKPNNQTNYGCYQERRRLIDAGIQWSFFLLGCIYHLYK